MLPLPHIFSLTLPHHILLVSWYFLASEVSVATETLMQIEAGISSFSSAFFNWGGGGQLILHVGSIRHFERRQSAVSSLRRVEIKAAAGVRTVLQHPFSVGK